MTTTLLSHIALQNHCAALEAENAQLRAAARVIGDTRNRLWNASPDLMLAAQFDGVMMDTNPAWITLLGWAEQELVGCNLFDLVHPDDVDRTIASAKGLAEGKTLGHFSNRYRHKDGSYRCIDWAAVLGGGLINAVGRDVTDEEEQTSALHRSEEALRQSQKMEVVGQLTGGLAHDFNNLLTSISGSLELLQARLQQGQTSDLGQYITAAQGASKRAAALTHRLLAFSRQQALDPKPISVNRLITGIKDLICRTMGPEIMVKVSLKSALWTTWTDPNQLENALLNLCINARDAMPQGGQLTIETLNTWLPERIAREYDLPMGQYMALAVSDTGSGMAPQVIERAFDPFFTTKPIGKGTGLGLSMIDGFARQAGGHVWIESELGRGTTVCLYLPRHMGAAAEAETDAEASGDLTAAPRAGEGETVLVVDDEPTVRELVTDVLQGLGYTAIAVADGTAGLKVLQSDARIDLLVTDIGLPNGMDGQQMADAGRALRPDLKVLFITGYESEVISQDYLEPNTHVLTKPFRMGMLAKHIKDLIGRS